MKKSSITALLVIPCSLLAITFVISGCGGGATNEPTVTTKSSTLETSEDSANTDTGNGKTPGSTPAGGSGPGTIVGRILFEGTPPNLAPLVAKGANIKDAQYCSAEPVPNQSLVVGAGGGLANVFIYLDGAPKGYKPPESLDSIPFDQENCKFIPHGLVVQVGQTMNILNSDGCSHNTNVKAVRNKAFNSTVNPYEKDGVPLVFEKPEKTPIKAVCDFHSWMNANILVVDHPFAVCTSEDGTFEINDIPAGKYKFRVWHESADFLERSYSVTVKPGEATKIELKYDQSKFGKL